MSIQKLERIVNQEIGVEIPDTREYDSAENAELDRALVDAIEAADEAGDEYLVQLLSTELGSHYYETR
jgi:hypothetical protein